MKARSPARGRGVALALGLAALVAGCAAKPPPPPPPPPPTLVDLTLRATPSANPDAAGVPKPVRVRVLQLKAPQSFSEADFFALDGDPAKVLGPSLEAAQEFVLPPGGQQGWKAELKDGVSVVGVMAAYSAVDRARWRVWRDIPPNRTTRLVAELGADGIQLRDVQP